MSKCITCQSEANYCDSKYPHLTFCNETCQAKNYIGLIVNGVNNENLVGLIDSEGKKYTISKEDASKSKVLRDLIENAKNYDDYILLPFSWLTMFHVFLFLTNDDRDFFEDIERSNNFKEEVTNLMRAAIYLELNLLIAIIFKRYYFFYEILLPQNNPKLLVEFRDYLPLEQYFESRYKYKKRQLSIDFGIVDVRFVNFKIFIKKPFEYEFENEHFIRVMSRFGENIYRVMMQRDYIFDAKFIASIPLEYGPYDFSEFKVDQNILIYAIQRNKEEFVKVFLELDYIDLNDEQITERIIISNNVNMLKMFLDKKKNYNISLLVNTSFEANSWSIFLYLIRQPNVEFFITYDILSLLLSENLNNIFEILQELKRQPIDDFGINDSILLLSLVYGDFELFKIVYSIVKRYFIDVSIPQIFNLLSQTIEYPEIFKFLYRQFNAYVDIIYNEETEKFEIVDRYNLESPFVIENSEESQQLLNELAKNKRNKLKFLIKQ